MIVKLHLTQHGVCFCLMQNRAEERKLSLGERKEFGVMEVVYDGKDEHTGQL
jgi:hypothetical protein